MREGNSTATHIAMPGGDWMNVSADRFGRPNVRVQFVTGDGAIILLHYTGLVEANRRFPRSGRRGRRNELGRPVHAHAYAL